MSYSNNPKTNSPLKASVKSNASQKDIPFPLALTPDW